MSVRCMGRVPRSARTQRAAMNVSALMAFSLLVSRTERSVLLRVRAQHSNVGQIPRRFPLMFHLLNQTHLKQNSPHLPLRIGNPPVLLLPDNVRIRRFNASSEQYSDYVDNAEHIQALDYLWDPEGLGLSKTHSVEHLVLCGYSEYKKQQVQVGSS